MTVSRGGTRSYPGVRHAYEQARQAVSLSGDQLRVDPGSRSPIYQQIISQIQELLATGALKPGDRLPPVRQLADPLGIAAGSVARAYSELERIGVVVTEGARGTWIAVRNTNLEDPAKRREKLLDLLRPAAVAAFHLGASSTEFRRAAEEVASDLRLSDG